MTDSHDMTCRDLVDRLGEYVDDDPDSTRGQRLAPELRRALDEHLDLCPPCVEYLESYVAALEAGRQVFDAELEDEGCAQLPEALVQSILKAARDA